MTKVSYDRIAAILLVFVACFALWRTRGLSDMSYLFPRTVGFILLIVCVIYLIVSLMDKRNKGLMQDTDPKNVLAMSVGLIGYVSLIAILGFLLASIIYICITTLYLQRSEKKRFRKKLFHAILFAMSVSVGFYVLFTYVFLIQLPISMFME